MTGFGLVVNMGSFRMPVAIKPMTISGTIHLLLDKRAHERGPIKIFAEQIDQDYVITDHLNIRSILLVSLCSHLF